MNYPRHAKFSRSENILIKMIIHRFSALKISKEVCTIFQLLDFARILENDRWIIQGILRSAVSKIFWSTYLFTKFRRWEIWKQPARYFDIQIFSISKKWLVNYSRHPKFSRAENILIKMVIHKFSVLDFLKQPARYFDFQICFGCQKTTCELFKASEIQPFRKYSGQKVCAQSFDVQNFKAVCTICRLSDFFGYQKVCRELLKTFEIQPFRKHILVDMLIHTVSVCRISKHVCKYVCKCVCWCICKCKARVFQHFKCSSVRSKSTGEIWKS